MKEKERSLPVIYKFIDLRNKAEYSNKLHVQSVNKSKPVIEGSDCKY